MEYINEKKKLQLDSNGNIYEAVRKAILQLNIWLNSIEENMQVATQFIESNHTMKLTDGISSNVDSSMSMLSDSRSGCTILQQIYDKMNSHQDRLLRIVQICRDLSKRAQSPKYNNQESGTSELSMINEYIEFVGLRYRRLHQQVEKCLENNRQQIVYDQCSIVKSKLEVYENVLQSLWHEVDFNTNNHGQLSTLKDKLIKVKVMFTQYSKEVDRIRKQINIINRSLNPLDRGIEKNDVNLIQLSQSISSLEGAVDQEWKNISHILRPSEAQSFLCVSEFNEIIGCVRMFEDEGDLKEEEAKLQYESMSLNDGSKDKEFPALLFCPESLNDGIELEIDPYYKSKIFPFENYLQMNSFRKDQSVTTHPYACNLIPIPSRIQANIFSLQIHLSKSLKNENITTTYTQLSPSNLMAISIPYQLNKLTINNCSKLIKYDSITSIPYTPFFATISKCPLNEAMIKLLNMSTKIINKKSRNVDEMLYRHILAIEKDKLNNFDVSYEFLSESTYSNTMNSILKDYSFKSNDSFSINPSPLSKLLKPVQIICDMIGPKYLRGRLKLRQKVVNLIMRCSQVPPFDVGMSLILMIREIIQHVWSRVHWENLVQLFGEINQYRMISATY